MEPNDGSVPRPPRPPHPPRPPRPPRPRRPTCPRRAVRAVLAAAEGRSEAATPLASSGESSDWEDLISGLISQSHISELTIPASCVQRGKEAATIACPETPALHAGRGDQPVLCGASCAHHLQKVLANRDLAAGPVPFLILQMGVRPIKNAYRVRRSGLDGAERASSQAHRATCGAGTRSSGHDCRASRQRTTPARG